MEHIARVLYRHWGEFQFIDIDKVLHDLTANGIIYHHEVNDIINDNHTHFKKVQFLVNSLLSRGDDALTRFVESLRRRGHYRFVNILDTGEYSPSMSSFLEDKYFISSF